MTGVQTCALPISAPDSAVSSKDAFDALQSMSEIGHRGSPHWTSMLYGYDGVDHQGISPIVWFNRGAFAVVDEALPGSEMKRLYDESRKVA